MFQKTLPLAIIIMFAGFASSAQNSREVGPPTPPRARYQSERPKTNFVTRVFKKGSKPNRELFRERMEAVQKLKKKARKKMKNPEYANPLYLGHKRPPKKRRLGKRKFCKVCHIVH